VQVASGELGGLPSVKGQRSTPPSSARQRLQTPEQFGPSCSRSTRRLAGALRDVGRVELGAENYSSVPKYNGHPGLRPRGQARAGANALETANGGARHRSQLEPLLPAGLKAVYPYDTTPFIRISIEEVVKTLFEAIVLVFMVMYVFLQNFRATLIPTIAVPVVLLGTFGILAAPASPSTR
jgi:multidrug efflux pump